MTPENFVYWLNGFFEISGSKTLTEEQVQVLKEHLKLVLTKKTPDITITNPGLGNGIVINPLYRGPEITCSTSDKIDLNQSPVCGTTGVSPLTVDGGVVPLTVSPVSFENDEPFICFTKSGLK